jgi:hypothetical protein
VPSKQRHFDNEGRGGEGRKGEDGGGGGGGGGGQAEGTISQPSSL